MAPKKEHCPSEKTVSPLTEAFQRIPVQCQKMRAAMTRAILTGLSKAVDAIPEPSKRHDKRGFGRNNKR